VAIGGKARVGNIVIDSEQDKIIVGNIEIQGVPSAGLPYTMLADDTIRIPVAVMILGSDQSVAADALGTPTFAHTTFVVPTSLTRHLYSAKLVIDYTWAATADGTIQLYDSTAAAVVAESSAKVGGESSEWEEISIDPANITEGNTWVVRANVTAAGAAGETATLHRALLLLEYRIS
jgi:hypothetical protein